MSLLTVDPFLASSSSKALSDREKRRKLAKLARTLGENIPPELVFRSNTSNNSSSSSSPRRRASLSIKPYSNSGFSTTTSKAPTLPPLAVAEMPLPTLSSESVPQPRPKQTSNLLARARPRSLALGSASSFVAANNALSSKTHRNVVEASRGTTSLDVQRQRGVQLLPLGVSTKPRYPPSPRPFMDVAAPQSQSSSSSSSSDTSDDGESDNDAKNGASLEWGRRKEREWSGEWNLRDMEDVAMKLRCLKGR